MTLKQFLDGRPGAAAAFAAKLGVSRQAVERYRDGQRIPRPQHMRRIQTLTGGAVTPADFYGLAAPRRRRAS